MADDELDFVNWLRERGSGAPFLTLGIGDDMAMLETQGGRVLMSSDMLLDGVHFDSARDDLLAIGRKAVACNVSDCAAMAVRPLAVTVSVALPRCWPIDCARQLAQGALDAAREFGIAVAGGDTTRWDQPLAIDVAIVGECFAGVEPVRRSGAKPGDRVFVTGELGGSLLGRHLVFQPRVAEARALATALGRDLHAMIDISDGLSLDLSRICEASGVGACLDELLVAQVVSEDAREASLQDGTSPLEHALGDGEDFELLVVVAPEVGTFPVPLHCVGEITALREGFRLRTAGGAIRRLEPKGFVH